MPRTKGKVHAISDREVRSNPVGQGPPLVYIIGESNPDAFKIGISSGFRMRERVSGLQCGNPRELHVYGYIYTPDAALIEKALHKYFASDRLQSEWFDRSDDLDELVRGFRDFRRMKQDLPRWAKQYEASGWIGPPLATIL